MNPVILPANTRVASNQTIHSDWSLAWSTAGAVATITDLGGHQLQWQPATVPGTVAQSLEHGAQQAQLHQTAQLHQPTSLTNSSHLQHTNLDDVDWWYRSDFQSDSLADENPSGRRYLCLDGLATVASVWLNGHLLLQSNNMFVAHRLDVTEQLQANNQLVICFHSLSALLNQKKPRPAWKTNLVSHQNLRWFRTTLLGRMPSWEPKLSAVGPWRDVRIEQVEHLQVIESRLTTTLQGNTGIVEGVITCKTVEGDLTIASASLQIGTHHLPVSVIKATPDTYTVTNATTKVTTSATTNPTTSISTNGASDDDAKIDGADQGERVELSLQGAIENVAQWWPHTHGNPQLLDCQLLVETNQGQFTFDLGRRGFKSIELLETPGQLTFVVNGEAIFCRGACWSSNDIVSLTGSANTLRSALQLAKDAGMNMLRVGGTMTYESDDFYHLCDELGIMVWQDFMFASMDYPVDDSAFAENIQREVQQQLARLSAHVSITAFCGNSDVQLQGAMMGAPQSSWSNDFFDQQLRVLCSQYNATIPYFPSTPCGGAMPFHLDQGLAHYYGVGAFKRPLSDIGPAGIKFASEGMGFSNIPEPATIEQVFNGDKPLMHDPRWKTVVPRDAGMGWDFEDIRDHYFQQLFHQDPIALRSVNPERYLELSRVVSGEMLTRVFAQWRSAANPCSGGLLWFYNDLVPGPGWGFIDSSNRPKAAYHAIRRAFFPLAVFLEDRGLNGFHIHLINESNCERQVLLDLTAYRHGDVLTLETQQQLTLPKRANITLSADELLGYFSDMGYAYQFGPVQHEVIALRMRDAISGEFLDDDHYFPVTHTMANLARAEVQVELIQKNNSDIALQLTSATFLQFVRLDLKTHRPEDNYFHLAPGQTREIKLQSKNPSAQNLSAENPAGQNTAASKPVTGQVVKGYLEALNLLDPIKLNVKWQGD